MASVSPAEIAHAATMLVTTALHVREKDRFVVIGDAESHALGAVIGEAAEKVGAQVTLARLDLLQSVSTNHSGERPHKVLPDLVRRSMLGAQASVFIASAPHQELSMREQLLHIVGACKVRHAHMPGISEHAFALGMRIDYDRLESWGRAMERRLEMARLIEVQSPAGTELALTFPERSRWTAHLGQIGPGKWSTLPAGALYAQPGSVDGVFVANASVSEFFGAKEGLLLDKPVRFVIESGKVTHVEAPRAPELQRGIQEMLKVASNSDRVSLVAVGVNVGLEGPTGEAVVDENLPGLHLVIGDAAGRTPTSTFTARTSFFACGAGGKVIIDGTVALDGGKIGGGAG